MNSSLFPDAWYLTANYFPVVVEVAISGFVLATFIHKYSKNETPPCYHWVSNTHTLTETYVYTHIHI